MHRARALRFEGVLSYSTAYTQRLSMAGSTIGCHKAAVWDAVPDD